MHHRQVRKSLAENSIMSSNHSNDSGTGRHSAIGSTRAPGLKTTALKVVTKQDIQKQVTKVSKNEGASSRQSTDEMLHTEKMNKKIVIPSSPKLKDTLDCRRLQATSR